MMMVSSERMRSAQISFIQKASTNSDNGGDGSSNSKRKTRNAHKEIGSKDTKDKEDKGKDEKSRKRNDPKMTVVAVAASVAGQGFLRQWLGSVGGGFLGDSWWV